MTTLGALQLVEAEIGSAPKLGPAVLVIDPVSHVWYVTDSDGNFVENVGSGGITTVSELVITDAASKIIPGATSLAMRDHADTVNNILITDAGVVTVRAGLVVTAGGATVTAGDLTITAGNIVVATAATKVIPGATSFAVRNHADSLNNLVILDNGAAEFRSTLFAPLWDAYLKFGPVESHIIAGATSIAFRDNADNNNNVLVTDAGVVTVRASLSSGGAMFPASANTGAAQATTGLWVGVGAPNNTFGADGAVYIRGDGAAGTMVYTKAAGSWTAII